MTKISVIIRCKNEEDWIGHAIQSVLDHISCPEIIIVNDQSQDESMDVVKMFETFSNVKFFDINDYSPGKALNIATNKCEHDIILILSAHCVITAFDESKVAKHLDKYVAVFGNQTPVYRGKRVKKRYVWSNFTNEECENMWSKYEERYFLHNAFAMYKKAYLINNPFDEILYGKEDRYWAIEAIDKGDAILYDPSLTCIHHWTSDGATWKGIG